jgi:hypothetical protein
MRTNSIFTPPPSYVFTEVALMAAEENADYF